MRNKIKVKDAILITILFILLWVSYFTIKYYQFSPEDTNVNISATTLKERPAKYYIDLAKEEFWKKNYEDAIRLWEKALKSNPYHPEGIYHDIGMSYVLLRQYEKAIDPLNKAIELGADYDSTYYYLGEAYYYLGHSSTAKENYEKVVSIERKNNNQALKRLSYAKLGQIEELLGNHQKAQEYWQKAQQ